MEGGQAAPSGAHCWSGRQQHLRTPTRRSKAPPHIICPICACTAGLAIASSICFILEAICASSEQQGDGR